MFAMLDSDNKTVIAVFPPNISYDDMLKEANGRTLIEMTIKNSPGYIGGIYENEKFYPSKELTNG